MNIKNRICLYLTFKRQQVNSDDYNEFLFTVRLQIVDVLSKGFQRDFPRRKCWKLPIKILMRITIRKSSLVMSYHLQKGFLRRGVRKSCDAEAENLCCFIKA